MRLIKRVSIYLIILLVAGTLLSLCNSTPVKARFSDSEIVQARLAAGEWVTPEIYCICPCWGISGLCRWLVVINGEHLAGTVQVTFSRDSSSITATSIGVVNDHMVSCVFNLAGAPPGTYGITVRNSSGITGFKVDCFTIYGTACPGTNTAPQESPQLPASEVPQKLQDDKDIETPGPPLSVPLHDNFIINPKSGHSGEIVDIVMDGGPFSAGLQAHLKGDRSEAWSLECRFPSSSRMECRFDLYGIPAGVYKLEILDYRGNMVYLAGYFEVLQGSR